MALLLINVYILRTSLTEPVVVIMSMSTQVEYMFNTL